MPRLHAGKNIDKLSRSVVGLRNVPQEGLTQQIVRKFRLLVLRGRIKSGDYLPPERQFATMLGVSRSSLRGALKALQIMGALEVRQGTGTYLTEAAKEILATPTKAFHPSEVLSQAELFEARRWIEAGAAATAVDRATEADLAAIRAEYEAMKKCAADKNIPRYGRHDMAFHQAIAAASGNRFFIWFLATANKALFRELWKRPLPIDVNCSLRGHERILRTIEARDRAAAQEEMLNHLSYRSYFAEQDSTADLRFVAERSLGKMRSRAGGRVDLPPSARQIQAR